MVLCSLSTSVFSRYHDISKIDVLLQGVAKAPSIRQYHSTVFIPLDLVSCVPLFHGPLKKADKVIPALGFIHPVTAVLIFAPVVPKAKLSKDVPHALSVLNGYDVIVPAVFKKGGCCCELLYQRSWSFFVLCAAEIQTPQAGQPLEGT